MNLRSLPLMRTCKQAAALLVAREDRALSLSDTVGLKLHLIACKTCPLFENQILTVRQAMAQWRQPPDEKGDQAGPGQP